jgi:hypothetical protein
MSTAAPYHIAMRILMVGIGIVAAATACALPFQDMLNLPVPTETRRASVMVALGPGESYALLEADGPGCITHIWMTTGAKNAEGLRLRMYWDDDEPPSVDLPLTYFFGVGHGENAPPEPFASACLAVAPQNGYNSYWPMPFKSRARITVTNESDEMVQQGGGVYFQGTYRVYDELREDLPLFRAALNRSSPAPRRGQPHNVVMTEGRGFLGGVSYHVGIHDESDAWFHGGGDYIFLDGGTAPNLIKGIGGEDFIGQSWHNARFIMANAGCTVAEDDRVSLYRFFLEAPPIFEESVRFAFGAMANDITSVGYWYQASDTTAGLPVDPLPLAIIGPFAGNADTATPLDGLHPMDTTASLRTNYAKPYRVNDALFDRRVVRWEASQTILHWLDLEAAFKPKMPQVVGVSHMPNTFAYALLRVHTDTAAEAKIRIGHDDGVRIWLNGQELESLQSRNGFGQSVRDLSLKAGANDVLFKIENLWNTNFAAWALAIKLEPLEGLRIEPWAELPTAPIYGTSPELDAVPQGPPVPDSSPR